MNSLQITSSDVLRLAEETRLAEESPIHTTVVIPVYFNEASVARVVENVRAAWCEAERPEESLEFVLVDDGSTDNSWRVLQTLRSTYRNVTAVRLVRNHGSQLAVLAGASLARGRFIAVIAADAQEPANLIERMATSADKGHRLVLAVRVAREDSLGTKTNAAFFYKLIRTLGLHSMPAQGFDLFLMEREMMGTILEMRDPNVPLAVTIAWLGYPYDCVEYERLAREDGKSRWSFFKKVKLALDSITAISYAPIRIISLWGVILALIGFLYAIFIVISRLTSEIQVPGWSSLLVAVLVIGGTQLIALGVIGEYLWRTLEVARARPLWRIAELEKSPEKSSTPD